MASKVIQDVKRGKLHSAYVIGPFDQAKEDLESEGYRVISLEEQAGLRIGSICYNSLLSTGNWVREGFIHIPNKGVFLTKDSPIIENAKEATDCHRNDNEFYLNDGQVEKSLANSVKVTDNPDRFNVTIPTMDFGDEAITSFAFGRNASAYGEFIHNQYGIYRIEVGFAFTKDRPFARPISLRGVDECEFSSEIRGYFAPKLTWTLARNLVMRGIKETA